MWPARLELSFFLCRSQMQFITVSRDIKELLPYHIRFSWKFKNFPPQKVVIVFSYYPKVRAVTFEQQYMLNVDLLSWQQEYHFSSIALFIHSFPLSLCTDEADMRIILFCCYQYTSTVACHLDIFNLKLIEYNCSIHIALEPKYQWKEYLWCTDSTAIPLMYQKQGSAKISEPFKAVLVIAFKIQH